VISIIDGCPGDDEFCGNLESVGNSAAALASRHIPEISDHEAAGSDDLCFLTSAGPEAVIAHLRACGVAIEEGPLPKTGATGALRSFYVRDPDGNLVEISNLVQPLA
jgi:catechol 2,3-dioxygenase-like lactoylglutathione lyase family enzyme